MTDDATQPVPTLMRRRWWVTFTVALAAVVVVVWWIRQPDGEPATDAPEDGASSAAAQGGPGLALPETFEAGGLTWTQDSSPEARAALEAALGAGFEGRTTAEDGTPGGAVYLASGSADDTDPLVTSIEVSDAFADADPVDTAVGVVDANLGQQIAAGEVGDGGVACGFLPVVTDAGAGAQQWICAGVRGDTVINLLWPLSIASGDDAAEQTTAFVEAATA